MKIGSFFAGVLVLLTLIKMVKPQETGMLRTAEYSMNKVFADVVNEVPIDSITPEFAGRLYRVRPVGSKALTVAVSTMKLKEGDSVIVGSFSVQGSEMKDNMTYVILRKFSPGVD